MLAVSGTCQGPSRIIVVSSIAGTHVPHVGEHGTILYSVSKAAAHHLSRNLAVELSSRNITSKTVAPGFFPSKLAGGLIEILGGEDEPNRVNPRGRLGLPEDIVGVILFLAFPARIYTSTRPCEINLRIRRNGEDIAVDGGNRLVQGSLSKL
jgi:NAD(P)-dependent dehydrogenase (short-subunit alcohol dehydrogenase family)